jgi:hypothetical protein
MASVFGQPGGQQKRKIYEPRPLKAGRSVEVFGDSGEYVKIDN